MYNSYIREIMVNKRRTEEYYGKNDLSRRVVSDRIFQKQKRLVCERERNTVELRVSTLLDFMDIVNITPEEFFYPDPEKFEEDRALLEEISELSDENKKIVSELIRKLK